MKLDDFRTKENLTFDALAEKLGITGKNRARTAQRYARNERTPPLSLIMRIEELTGGSVSISDFAANGRDRGRAA